MRRIKWALVTLVVVALSPSLFLPGSARAETKVYIGGSMALTGAYAENVAAVLAAFEDYANTKESMDRLKSNYRLPREMHSDVV